LHAKGRRDGVVVIKCPKQFDREHDILVVGSEGGENITGYPYGPEFNVI